MWEDLVCPFDQGHLHGHGDWLACGKCGRGYPVLDGIPTFLAPNEDEAWRHAQCRRVERLPASPDDVPSAHSVNVRRRGRALEKVVERYLPIGPATRMLQIGLPREAELHHFRQGVRYGIEPLAGVLAARGLLRWGQVRWVAGRGEELPFPDGHFRLVLLGDVLDHVESPGRVLEEACRCLAPDGVLWLTCRTACRGWRGMVGRLLGRSELAAGVRTCNRAAAALLRQCRQARLRRLWSAWSDLESSDQTEPATAFPDHPPREPINLELGARKQFLFHVRRAGLRAEAAFEQRAVTAA